MRHVQVSVYPNDPQARIGLAKCMDALQDMEAVWPAATRAHELLRGCDAMNKNASKHAHFGQLVTRQSGQERQKRAAEHAADSEDAYERARMHVPSSEPLAPAQPYAQAWRSTQFNPVSHETGPGPGHGDPGDFASTTPLPTSQPSSYYSWPSDGGSYGTVPFPGTLSTSVLPQMYSTGLSDERRVHTLSSSQHGQTRSNGHSHSHGHGHGHSHSHTHSHSAGGSEQGGYDSTSGGRYPQYWNDYTSFPQMGIAYGQSPAPGQGQGQEGMYMNGHYGGIYGA